MDFLPDSNGEAYVYQIEIGGVDKRLTKVNSEWMLLQDTNKA